MSKVPDELIRLAHLMADPANDLCILAEGNVSCRSGEDELWIKASGAQMREIGADGFSHVKLAGVCTGLDEALDDQLCRQLLNRATFEGPAPSTETFMHAWLLQETGAQFVAHCHPTAVLSLCCLDGVEEWVGQRLFPDEIVCCGPASCFVPYVAPGLMLAQSIRDRAKAFRNRVGVWPKTFWMANHGLICIGASANEVTAAAMMSVKSARVLLGALATGQEPRFLSKGQVDQIMNWPDEHARQSKLFA